MEAGESMEEGLSCSAGMERSRMQQRKASLEGYEQLTEPIGLVRWSL